MKDTCTVTRYKASKLIPRLALAAVAFLACSLLASAQNAGYDLFQTGSGAYVDTATMGRVYLAGVPFQASTGNTDTMMKRDAVSNGSANISMYVLYLKSTSSVNYNGQPADMYITVNASNGDIPQSTVPQVDTLPLSTGSISLQSGGTFNSSINVNADCIIVKSGGQPTNAGDILSHQPAPSILLQSMNSTYTTTPPSGYPSTKYGSGGFYPRPNHTGPHPVIPSSCGPGTKAAATKGAASQAQAIACIAYATPQTPTQQ